MKVFGYIRVSTDMQAEKGYGAETQAKEIEDYCNSKNLDLVKIFDDLGISGTEVDRAGLKSMIDAVCQNDVEKIVVKNTSRLWRDDLATAVIKRKFLKLKLDIISIEQPNYSISNVTPSEAFINKMLEAIDQLDRDNIVQKLIDGRKTKVRSGVKGSGNAPFGYEWCYQDSKPSVIPVNDETPIVQDIFNKYMVMKSTRKVSQYLSEKGYKTNKGLNFSSVSVNNILRNTFYVGEVVFGDIRTQGKHEPIISKVIFGKVQAQLSRNVKVDRNKTKTQNR